MTAALIKGEAQTPLRWGGKEGGREEMGAAERSGGGKVAGKEKGICEGSQEEEGGPARPKLSENWPSSTPQTLPTASR